MEFENSNSNIYLVKVIIEKCFNNLMFIIILSTN